MQRYELALIGCEDTLSHAVSYREKVGEALLENELLEVNAVQVDLLEH